MDKPQTRVTAVAGLFAALQTDHLRAKGTWDYPFRMGDAYLWADGTADVIRVKWDAAPAAIDDGDTWTIAP